MTTDYKLRRTQHRKLNGSETSTVSTSDEITIDLSELWKLIQKNIWSLVLIAIFSGILAGGFTWIFVPATYASSGTLFLTPRVSEGEIDINSLNSNQKLVSNVINLITQDNIMTTVAQDTGMESAQSVRDTLSVTNVANTEIITVTATTEDPKLSKAIATDTIDTFIDIMKDSLNVQNIQVTDVPKLSYKAVGPSIKKNAIIGASVGFLVGLLFLFIRLLTDKRLKTREEAEKYLGLPVYAELPDLEK